MTASNAHISTIKLYQGVVDEVIMNVKEAFLDEGVDEALLSDLKQIWENKILASRAVDSLDSNFVPVAVNKLNTVLGNAESSSNSSLSNHRNNQPAIIHHQNIYQDNDSQETVDPDAELHRQLFCQPKSSAYFEPFPVEYNPHTVLRPHPVHQHSTMASSSNFMNSLVDSAQLGALVRALPQSVITRAQQQPHHQKNVLARQVESSHSRQDYANGTVYPPPLTATNSGSNPAIHFDPLMSKIESRFNASTSKLDKALVGLSSSNGTVIVPQLQPVSNNELQQHPSLSSSFLFDNLTTMAVPQPIGVRGRPPVASGKRKVIVQLDGPVTMTDDENDSLNDDEELDVENIEGPSSNNVHDEGDALNSEDDERSYEENDETFEADDVIVCQFEKVNRIRNKWKFILKDGIINLSHKDYVFNRAVGEAEF